MRFLLILVLSTSLWAQARNVTFTWQYLTTPLPASYNIYCGPAPGGENYTAPINASPIPGTATTYVWVAGYTPGTVIYCTAKAVDSAGNLSAPSNEGQIKPAAPTGTVVTPQ